MAKVSKLSAAEIKMRDQIAVQVLGICMADVSRQIAAGVLLPQEWEITINSVASIAYLAAHATLARRRR